MTPLDAAHAAMAAAPDDDGARLRFWGALAEARLLLLLAEEASGERIVPAEAEVEGGRFVMAFDTEDRLAGFAGIAVPHAVLSGRALAGLLAGQGIGLALNPDVAPSAILCPAEVIDWLAVAIPGVPEAIESRIAELLPPWRLPETVVAAIGRRLGLAGGLAEAAWLAEARHADGDDDDGAVRCLGQTITQPVELDLFQPPVMARWLNGTVQQDDAIALYVDDLVDKAGRTGQAGTKDVEKCLAVVVIADRDVDRNSQIRQDVPEPEIGLAFAKVGQVPGNCHEIGVCVAGIDRSDTGAQTFRGIERDRRLPVANDVQVAQHDDLECHWPSPRSARYRMDEAMNLLSRSSSNSRGLASISDNA